MPVPCITRARRSRFVIGLTGASMGKWIMLAGAVVFAIGAILHFAPWMLSWFGRLPGDIRVESENGKIFFPFTSMLLVSLVLTILVNLFRR